MSSEPPNRSAVSAAISVGGSDAAGGPGQFGGVGAIGMGAAVAGVGGLRRMRMPAPRTTAVPAAMRPTIAGLTPPPPGVVPAAGAAVTVGPISLGPEDSVPPLSAPPPEGALQGAAEDSAVAKKLKARSAMAAITVASGSSPACEFHVYIESYARCVVLA